MKTNRTNWIKLPEHETESFTHTLPYFAAAVLLWTIYFLKVMHYRNSVLYKALLLSEFHISAMQISLHLMRIWGIYTMAGRGGGCIDGVWSIKAWKMIKQDNRTNLTAKISLNVELVFISITDQDSETNSWPHWTKKPPKPVTLTSE